MANLEGVQLHVGISMSQALDHASRHIFPSTLFTSDLVDHIHDVLPVLTGEILVSRLGCKKRTC